MRIARRLSFATPFVVVVAAACGSKPAPEPPHRNPPGPTGLSSEQCKALTNDTACEGDESCKIDGDGCGLVGYHCRDGKWLAEEVACNPPPPSVE